MRLHFIIFWTDALIYLLVIASVIFFRWARRYEHVRIAWQQVAQSRIAVGCSLILIIYVGIALLDSVHFQTEMGKQGTNVKSLLDYLVQPLGENDEKTYSAPFATHLYNKALISLSNVPQFYDYPRLLYGGADLHDPLHDRYSDITNRLLQASLYALGTWLILVVIFIFYITIKTKNPLLVSFKTVLICHTKISYRALLITMGIIILIAFNAFDLSREYHILGTDKVGQDVFYETLKSIRTGLVIGTLTTLVILPFAVLLGTLAGYFRGWIDDVIQYIYTTLSSVPDVLLIAAAILALQIFITNHPQFFTSIPERADLRLLALCIILGITSWTNLCRLLRGETLKLRELDYVQAARALGVKHGAIITRHIIPNLLHLIIIAVVMDFSSLVLAEAVLTYVGVGVDPTMISWGNMINAARLELAREPIVWWPLLAAFLFMFVLVISANLFADTVRDALDPRIRSI